MGFELKLVLLPLVLVAASRKHRRSFWPAARRLATLTILIAPNLLFAIDPPKSSDKLDCMPPLVEMTAVDGLLVIRGKDFEASAPQVRLDRARGILILVGTDKVRVRIKRDYPNGVVTDRGINDFGQPFESKLFSQETTAMAITISLKDGKIVTVHTVVPK